MHHLLFVQAYAPLHAGTGQGVGVIDLPIARERPTNVPILPGSSLKGALRAAVGSDDPHQELLFGPPTDRASDHAGAIQFSDQTLVLLPVRSLAGTFAYVTCPYLLNRLARDARLAGATPPTVPEPDKDRLLRGKSTSLVADESSGRVVFEDLDFLSSTNDQVDEWAKWLGECIFKDGPDAEVGRKGLTNRLVIVQDDFFHYLAEHTTEVKARIKLKEDTKTVQKGGLWYEESLPAESILWGLVHAEAVARKQERLSASDALNHFASLLKSRALIQLGGKATVGKGLCRLQWVEG